MSDPSVPASTQPIPPVGAPGTPAVDTTPLHELRPSPAAYGAYVKRSVPLAIILVILLVIRARDFLPLALGLLVVALAIGFFSMWRFMRTASISSTHGELVRRNLWGREALRVPLDRIGESFIGVVSGGVQPLWTLLVVDRDGRKLLRLNGGLWHVHELARFADGLPGEKLVADGVVTPKAVRERYPLTVSWAEAHPVALGLLIALGLILLVAGIVVAIALGGGIES